MTDMDFLELRAMQRADLTRQDFEPQSFEPRQNNVPPKPLNRVHEKITKMPVEFPENRNYPSFKTVFEEENKRQRAEEIGNNKSNEPVSDKLSGLLHDPEAALLGGLIMLLKSEGADESLLAALSYILL